MRLTKLTTALLLCLLTSVSGQQGDERGERFFYGPVLETSGATFLDAANPTPIRVTKGTRLYGGQTLRCRNKQGRCVITVEVCDVRERQIIIAVGGSRRIPSVVCKPSADELKKFRTAGRDDRSRTGGYVLSPSDSGVFRPETFVIRWRPPTRHGKLSLSIEDEAGVTLWAEEIDGQKGLHDSARLRDALKRAQAEGRLKLSLTAQVMTNTPQGGYDEIQFRLLPKSSEEILNSELASWEAESGVMRHLGRAGTFSSYELYAESAQELERALGLSPADVDLMVMTISAESYTQNRQRVVELCRRLRRLAPRRPHCSCTNSCRP